VIAKRVTAIAVVFGLALATAGPVAADQLTDKRDEARRRRDAAAGQLNLTRASDARVEAEVNRLAAAVEHQQAKANDARQAEAAAMAEVDASRRQLDQVAAVTTQRREELRRRALVAYLHPAGSLFASLTNATDLSDVARRAALLRSAQASTSDLLDRYRAARDDLVGAKRGYESTRAKAAERARQERAEAARLTAAKAAQEAAHQVLTARIADLQTETRVYAAQEGQVQQLIKARDDLAAATLAAAAAKPRPRQDMPKLGGASGSRPAPHPSGAGFIWPVHGPVTSEFGPRWGGFHPGIDIAPGYGTPIAAAKDGVVAFAGWMDGYGNFIIIDHGGGFATAYGHQSRLAVSDGQAVSAGQVIGYVGSTGFSTGPHLHFEIRVNGTAVNPRGYESGDP
jgi:murein DD-endopeptidase MepM/ murein hydrolase activator NlpD